MHDKGGAVQRRVLALAQEQAAMGHDVTIFAAAERGEFTLGAVTVRGLSCRLKRPLRDYEYLLRVRAALRERSFDVIHSHGVPDAARILAGAARATKFILTVDFFRYRMTKHTLGKKYYASSLRRFATVCPVSNYCREQLVRFYGQEIDHTLQVVYNGVDTTQFYPDNAEAERVAGAYGLARDCPYVLYLGRVNRQKGSDTLPGLARTLTDIKVVVAGPLGQFGQTMGPGTILDLKTAGGTYLGAVPEADLRGLLTGASALVLPTREDEMFGMVLIEAGACGTPAVASDLGGIPEALGEGGLLFTVGNDHELAEKTSRLVHDDSLRQRVSTAARKNSMRFAWSGIARQYEGVYLS